MKITVLGSGTSQGVPVIACKCEVCVSEDIKDIRLRASVLFEVDGQVIVIDSGPDFRQQMIQNKIIDLDAILFTHEHKDHISGMDDIRAFNYKYQKPLDIYCTERVLKGLKREFDYVFQDNPYPGVPQVKINLIDNELFKVNGVDVIPIKAMHYYMPVTGYRIGDFTYITDANEIKENEIDKIKGSKVLIINALRKEKHLSHFNLEEALKVIELVEPEKAYLTHISHLMGKHEIVSLELPENVKIAHDGLIINI